MSDKIIEHIDKLTKGEYEKKELLIGIISGSIKWNLNSMLRMSQCPVCQRPADAAHKCHACQQYVHSIICSDPVGEEGHGQVVLCHLCSCKTKLP